jgi:hypothetical protein
MGKYKLYLHYMNKIIYTSIGIKEELQSRESPKRQTKTKDGTRIETDFVRQKNDLLLHKNHFPMFVFEELHKRVLLGDNGSSKENCVGSTELAFNYFEDYYPSQKVDIQNGAYF